MRSDEELKQSFHVSVHDGILDTAFLAAFKPSEEGFRQAELYRDAVVTALERAPEKILDGIVDLTPIEDTQIAPPARGGQIYMQVATHPKVRRVAIVGAKPFYRTLAKFVLIAAHNGDSIKLFNNKKEALEWLKHS